MRLVKIITRTLGLSHIVHTYTKLVIDLSRYIDLIDATLPAAVSAVTIEESVTVTGSGLENITLEWSERPFFEDNPVYVDRANYSAEIKNIGANSRYPTCLLCTVILIIPLLKTDKIWIFLLCFRYNFKFDGSSFVNRLDVEWNVGQGGVQGVLAFRYDKAS